MEEKDFSPDTKAFLKESRASRGVFSETEIDEDTPSDMESAMRVAEEGGAIAEEAREKLQETQRRLQALREKLKNDKRSE